MKKQQEITVIGAGLVGTLLSIMLARKGYPVRIFEKRADPREYDPQQNRSINLALSHRGWKALETIGVADQLRALAIPMYGRMVHLPDNKRSFQQYDVYNNSIFSISRQQLNELLLTTATAETNIRIDFQKEFTAWQPETSTLLFRNATSYELVNRTAELVIGADGIFSGFRKSLQQVTGEIAQPVYYNQGYKELTIPPDANNEWQMDPSALHIWPRGEFMLIALPNKDKSFTCTLFLPLSGIHSFEAIQTPGELSHFFETHFSDAMEKMPSLVEDFFYKSPSRLVSFACEAWFSENNALLIGDAAHAILPFFGQGMNAGFEDCTVLNELLEHTTDWKTIFREFQTLRKPNTDAIAELSRRNFLEMREKVADPTFLLRKKIEHHLAQKYPEYWTTLYSLVSFSSIPYAAAQTIGLKHQEILDRILEIHNIDDEWEQVDYLPYLLLEKESVAG